jgi:hypothetical protein
MHDACWSHTPNFECIRLVLEEVPDLLLIADKNGFTPLDYLPRDTWGEWNDFLERSRGILAPKYLRETLPEGATSMDGDTNTTNMADLHY